MTSTSSAAIDRTSDSTAQPEDPPRRDSQLPENNDGSASIPAVSDENRAKNEKINFQGETRGSQFTTAQDEQNTEKYEEGLDDFGLPIRVRAQPDRPTEDFSTGNKTSHDVQEVSHGPDDDARLKAQEGEETSKPDHPNEPEKEHQDTARKLEKSPCNSTPGNQAASLPVEAPPSQENEAPKELDVSTENQKSALTTAPTSGTQQSDTPYDVTSQVTQVPREKKAVPKASEWSHQRLTENKELDDYESEEESDGEWREMPALGEFDEYDDFGRLLARGAKREETEESTYQGLSGAGKGYTRVQLDEDAQSATSLDEDTSYLFKENAANSAGVEGEELRDAASQLQATKDILTESQKIAYVGVTRLSIHQMALELQELPAPKGARKALQKGRDATKMWSQATMARLYAHMDIDSAEQIMIEQLTEHGVQPADLVPPLMQNARVKNPLAEEDDASRESVSSVASPSVKKEHRDSVSNDIDQNLGSTPPPPYEAHGGEDIPEARNPSELPTSSNIDIDLRWTVLCDLFLVLIADAAYDSRSRSLLERIGQALEVLPLQITRFEKRVIDALEMQEAADNEETWDESEHMEKRRKMALKRRYMVMGLATVGGGLVIGLSAGLLAPVIGAGLAAGFTTVGISGTGAFLGGAGGTALIASSATLTGSTIGLRASNRRTGAVKTFEYRPLHNNRRVNLIITVSGWMTGKVDDVRLPYSTVDPIMGDLYSVLWEPEMLRSMGETINILATEVSITIVSSQNPGTWINDTLGFNARTSACPRKHRSSSVDGISTTPSRSF